MKALVLSGGGSKGSYEIGVWKALRKLKINFSIVTGTSSGALNGALVTENSYFKAKYVWQKLTMKTIFGADTPNITNNKDILKIYGKSIKAGGMNPIGLKDLIENALNKNKFFNSKINYGLVTYNLTSKKPILIEKKDLTKDNIISYLLASSACFPAFQKQEINNNKYIDGGFYDNLPINLAIKMGATEIIAVDLNAPGLKKKPLKNIPITYITPNNKLTNFLNFNIPGSRRNILLGYNDTMKVFKRLEGHYYTYYLGNLSKNKEKYSTTFTYTFEKIINNPKLLKVFSSLYKVINEDQILLKILENLGKDYGLDETKIYTYKRYNHLLLKSLDKEIKLYNTNNKNLKRIPLTTELYQKLIAKDYTYIRKIAALKPLEFLKALYLYTIKED